MPRSSEILATLFRSPLLWGASASAALFVPLDSGAIDNAVLRRYCTGHWAQYAEVLAFFVGLAALVMKWWDAAQQGKANSEVLSASPSALAPQSLPVAILTVVSLVGLGFVGTVGGITTTAAHWSATAPEKSLPIVVSGFSSALDPAALAIMLSTLLGFVAFGTHRAESRLRDGRRPSLSAASADLQTDALQRITQPLVQHMESLVNKQADLWRTAIDAAQERWVQQTLATGKQFESTFLAGWEKGLQAQLDSLSGAEQAAEERHLQLWGQMQQGTAQNGQMLLAQLAELHQATQALTRLAAGTEQLAPLEQAIDRNLTVLASAGRFEETLISLAAAVQLLSARLGQPALDARGDAKRLRTAGKAA